MDDFEVIPIEPFAFLQCFEALRHSLGSFQTGFRKHAIFATFPIFHVEKIGEKWNDLTSPRENR
jgi:hypothetical protein